MLENFKSHRWFNNPPRHKAYIRKPTLYSRQMELSDQNWTQIFMDVLRLVLPLPGPFNVMYLLIVVRFEVSMTCQEKENAKCNFVCCFLHNFKEFLHLFPSFKTPWSHTRLGGLNTFWIIWTQRIWNNFFLNEIDESPNGIGATIVSLIVSRSEDN